MRKIVVALSAAAAFAVAGFVPANAAPFGSPSGLAAAQEDIATVDVVHCRPGWQHHYPTRWRRANGCRRYYRGGAVYINPGFYSPGFYDPGFYGPGFSFGFYSGHHRIHRHRIHRW